MSKERKYDRFYIRCYQSHQSVYSGYLAQEIAYSVVVINNQIIVSDVS